MKQWIFALIAAGMLLVCAGCGNAKEETIQPEAASAVETKETESTAETQSAETEPASDEASREMHGASGGMGGSSEEAAYPEAAAAFEQYEFTDEETGLTIPYNLYLPEGYDNGERYPLVIFVADSSVNSDDVTAPLTQDGATIWATAQEQAKHPCIVLVPQYTTTLVSQIGMLTTDTHEWNEGLTLVKKLFDHIIAAYPVDESRIYGTGQSQGGMMTIAISDKYPDFYAAQYLVACQWNAEEMAAMADDALWITVCEGDFKAYPGMNASVAVWEAMGVSVVQDDAMWDSAAPAEQLDAQVEAMATRPGNIHYTVFSGGNHMGTWRFAYDIEAIRDWLFAQSK